MLNSRGNSSDDTRSLLENFKILCLTIVQSSPKNCRNSSRKKMYLINSKVIYNFISNARKICFKLLSNMFIFDNVMNYNYVQIEIRYLLYLNENIMILGIHSKIGYFGIEYHLLNFYPIICNHSPWGVLFLQWYIN